MALTANGTPLTTEKFQLAEKEPVDRSVKAYIVTVKSKPGKLLMQKCVQLGVPAGPLLGDLKAGRGNHFIFNRIIIFQITMCDSQPLFHKNPTVDLFQL